MALVPYLDESDLQESDRELLARPINLLRALANSPDGLRNFKVLPDWIRFGCALDPRLRELAILQVGYLTQSAYEFSHHVQIGYDFGVSDEDIRHLIAASEGKPHNLGEVETLVLAAAKEITFDMRISVPTWRALEEELGRERTIDLLIVTSFYNSVIRILGTLEVDVESEYADFLSTYPFKSGGHPEI